MKTIPFISVGLLCWTLTAGAQGFVHLTAGDTLTIGFDGVDFCGLTEGSPIGGVAYADFVNDLLGPGDSLRLEMFENSLSEPAVASQIYSPGTSVAYVRLESPGSWLDYQGVIRVSMLSGSVDIYSGTFFVYPDVFHYCRTEVSVPESSSVWLILLGGGALLFLRRSFQY